MQLALNLFPEFQGDRAEDILADMGGTGRIVSSIFKFVEIAEKTIELYQNKYPDQAFFIWDQGFPRSQPSRVFESVGDSLAKHLYRLHVREMLDRLLHGFNETDMELATDAELMIIFLNSSLRNTLNRDGTAAYVKIFRKHFQNAKVDQIIEGEPAMIYESYVGAADDIINKLRQRNRQERPRPYLPHTED